LVARRYNETRGNAEADLYELAKVYWPGARGGLPAEPTMVAAVASRSFVEMKGVAEELTAALNVQAVLESRPIEECFFASGHGAELTLGGQRFGYLGQISDAAAKQFDLRAPYAVLELNVEVLEAAADLVCKFRSLAQFPSIDRDLNLVVDEAVTWKQLADVVRGAAGAELEQLVFRDVYRGKQIDAEKKSVLFSLTFRAADRTLTNEEVDRFQATILDACGRKLGAVLRS
jgi:phenylalanyl-tRNA synthetase beta chain